jgi:hypothetical protein
MFNYEQLMLINADQEEKYMCFLGMRSRLGMLDKNLADELGISARALTERVTGRAGIKRETLLAMAYMVDKKNG